MKITGVVRARNEAEVLPFSLDHAAQFVDNIVVFDDASTDGTADIAAAHPAVSAARRGPKLERSAVIRARIMAIRKQEEVLRGLFVAAIIREREDAAYHPVFALIPEIPQPFRIFRKLRR